MGFGGDLIWTGVFRELHARDGRSITVVETPKLSDLFGGRLYDGAADLSQRPGFVGNPHLSFLPAVPKGALTRFIDRMFNAALSVLGLRRAYEHMILRSATQHAEQGAPRLIHIDMLILSYAERETRQRMIWKRGGHAIATILQSLGVRPATVRPELFLEPDEDGHAGDILKAAGVAGPFVVIEPDTNREWFGDLRAWPRERWGELVAALSHQRPDVPIVQVGVKDATLIAGAIDLRGKTTFRDATAIIRRSALFIGTEGGLMHAARAVDARALILWGGVTLPEFAGYPDAHTIICHRVACAPCGQKGWCDNGHVCMRSITVNEVLAAVLARLPETASSRSVAR